MRSFEMQRDFLLDWMEMTSMGGSIIDCLQRKHIDCLAIYGLGLIGTMVYNEIKDKIDVYYGIDKSVIAIDDNLEIFHINNIPYEYCRKECPVLITIIDEYPELYDIVKEEKIGNGIVYSIEDILYEEICYKRIKN